MSPAIPESSLVINPDGSVYHLNLKPEQVASSVICVGDPDRVERVSRHFDEIEFKGRKREFVAHTGTYRGKRISVISTGMGTDNVEIFMTELDALVNVDLKKRIPLKSHTSLNIVRVGTSGSIQPSLGVGSILASAFAVGLDTLMSFYDLPRTPFEHEMGNAVKDALKLPFQPYCVQGSETLLQKLGGSFEKGITVTCPGFFGPQGRAVRLTPARPNLVADLAKLAVSGYNLTNLEMETAGYYAMGRLLGHEVLSLNAIVSSRTQETFSRSPEEVVDDLITHVLENI